MFTRRKPDHESGNVVAKVLGIIGALAFVVGLGVFFTGFTERDSLDKSNSVAEQSEKPSGKASQRESKVDSDVTSEVMVAVKYIETRIYSNGDSSEKVLVGSSDGPDQVVLDKDRMPVSEGTTLTIQGTNKHYQVIGHNPDGFQSNSGQGIMYDSNIGFITLDIEAPEKIIAENVISVP